MATVARKTTRRRKRQTPGLREGFGGASTEDQSSLDQYLKEVSTHRLLTPPEEIELGRRSQTGDEQAIQELVRANLRFVISVAKKYQNRGLPLTDLIGEGNVGLLTAARKFDPDMGVKFISYAVWWIRQAILAALARHGRTVRVPLNRTADLSRIVRTSEALRQELRREPTPEEIASATGLALDVVQALAALNTADGRLGDGDTGTMLKRLSAGLAATDVASTPSLGDAFRALAMAASAATGSSLGTLAVTALMSFSKGTAGKTAIATGELSPLLDGAIDAMLKRGGAQLGDKTVLDSLAAIARALDGAADATALVSARAAAHAALEQFREQASKLARPVGILTKPCQPSELLREAAAMLATA